MMQFLKTQAKRNGIIWKHLYLWIQSVVNLTKQKAPADPGGFTSEAI